MSVYLFNNDCLFSAEYDVEDDRDGVCVYADEDVRYTTTLPLAHILRYSLVKQRICIVASCKVFALIFLSG